MKETLHIPGGISPIHEYRQQHEQSRLLMELFMENNYQPARVAMIDFFDPYKRWIGKEEAEKIYRLVDHEGDVLMLRSDITLFLAKKMSMELSNHRLPLRLCYADSILQDSPDHDAGNTVSQQAGIELIGLDGREGERECILLLHKALQALGDNDAVIHLGSRELADAIVRIFSKSGASAGQTDDIHSAIRNRRALACTEDEYQQVNTLCRFIGSSQEFRALLDNIRPTLDSSIISAAESLASLVEELSDTRELASRIRIDTSEIGHRSYYTGIVFSVYNQESEQSIAQGGRYDKLIASFGQQNVPALGFSLYPQKILQQNQQSSDRTRKRSPKPITIAIPKGRVYTETENYLAARNIDIRMPEREFMIFIKEHNVRIIQVKNHDLPTYIRNGVADMGIVGSDVLHESSCHFFPLADLPFGAARLCLAAGSDVRGIPQPGIVQRIATKFPHITRDYFHKKGIPVDIILLNGAIELAPILGLAPYIVDLVASGKTLETHQLSVLEILCETKIQLIANPAFYKVCYNTVDNLIRQMGI